MREIKDFIKNKKINFKKLKEFGFELIDNSYYYHTSLLKNQFKMSVKINIDNSIFTEIIDTETNEPYVLHLLEIKRSGYSEKIYKAYSEILEKVKKVCFEDEIFKANYTKEIVAYVKNKYENKKLFENLEISKSEYFEKQGNYPVISISFRNYDEENWENGFKAIKGIVERLYSDYKFF